jgi:hypothetical protein
MGMIKLLAAPVRSIVRFPLFQLAVVVAVILFLQAGDDKSARGQIFNGVDELVESTVGLFSAVFNVKSFTKSWLTIERSALERRERRRRVGGAKLAAPPW